MRVQMYRLFLVPLTYVILGFALGDSARDDDSVQVPEPEQSPSYAPSLQLRCADLFRQSDGASFSKTVTITTTVYTATTRRSRTTQTSTETARTITLDTFIYKSVTKTRFVNYPTAVERNSRLDDLTPPEHGLSRSEVVPRNRLQALADACAGSAARQDPKATTTITVTKTRTASQVRTLSETVTEYPLTTRTRTRTVTGTLTQCRGKNPNSPFRLQVSQHPTNTDRYDRRYPTAAPYKDPSYEGYTNLKLAQKRVNAGVFHIDCVNRLTTTGFYGDLVYFVVIGFGDTQASYVFNQTDFITYDRSTTRYLRCQAKGGFVDCRVRYCCDQYGDEVVLTRFQSTNLFKLLGTRVVFSSQGDTSDGYRPFRFKMLAA